jgi:signal transduction histidine kinase
MGDSRLALLGRHIDGHEFPIDIHLAPIRCAGHDWTLAVIRDASERHRVLQELQEARQRAEQVARMKGEFLALAAHDLTQPQQTLEFIISAIGGAVPRASDTGTLALQASALLARMRELLRMLLEISALESGAMRVNVEAVPVAELFRDLERQFAPAARAKSLEFGTDPCSHVVKTDPRLLRGMLSNLVANAIRYTPQGRVSVRCTAPADGGLQLAVCDTGIGIPADQLQRIFEDFHRLEEARQADREGFGLGLGIVRRLSDLLGLSVTVDSIVGRGSTFGIEVPAPKVHNVSGGVTPPDHIGDSAAS